MQHAVTHAAKKHGPGVAATARAHDHEVMATACDLSDDRLGCRGIDQQSHRRQTLRDLLDRLVDGRLTLSAGGFCQLVIDGLGQAWS